MEYCINGSTWLKDSHSKLGKVFKDEKPFALVALTALFIFAIVGIMIFANSHIHDLEYSGGESDRRQLNIYNSLARWDSLGFIRIADQGYVGKSEPARFPLYSITIRGVANMTGISTKYSGFLVSALSLIGFVFILKTYTERLLEKKVNPNIYFLLFIFACFPTSFFLPIIYSESIFLLVSGAALLAHQRDKYWLSAFFTALACLIKVQGVMLIGYFGLKLLIDKGFKFNLRDLIPFFGISGLFLYMAFLAKEYGDPFYFIEAQKYWGRLSDSYFMELVTSFRPFYLWFIIFVGMGIKGLLSISDKATRYALIAYSLALLFVPVASGSWDSFNRYVIVAFPLFIGAAIFLKNSNRTAQAIYFASSGFILCWYIMLFSNGYWVG